MNILPFSSSDAILDSAGGKGANLARLAQRGFPVPPGFILTTAAYRQFVQANHLDPLITSALLGVAGDDPQGLEEASARIREAFSTGSLPTDLEDALLVAYAQLSLNSMAPVNRLPVAVRSSATAEDLPGLSFAGQQDTFLNVIGEEQLRAAVVACWSSLWTARAIGYRLRSEIPQSEVSLAVVVQEQIPSDVSGVLFTANPLTGQRCEAVIDAAPGLGEALVSGQVEPDHFVVEAETGKILSLTLGEKRMATRLLDGGGVETRSRQDPDAQDQPALSELQVRQLAALGSQVQDEYGFPQDIEWAFAGECLYLLQSRPVTSLFPVPFVSFDPLEVWFSFGAVQGMLHPLTPLGQDALRYVIGGLTHMFEASSNGATQQVIVPAGERLWVKISGVMRHPFGSRLLNYLLHQVEPSVGVIIRTLIDEPGLTPAGGTFKPSTFFRILRVLLPVLPRFLRAFLRPEASRRVFTEEVENALRSAEIAPGKDRFERLAHILAFLRSRVGGAFPFLLPRFIPLFAPSMASLNLLFKIFGPDDPRVLEVTRGLPGNVTTEMDLALWETACSLSADPSSQHLFEASNAAELARCYLERALPPAAQNALAGFLGRYGARGIGEIDLGNPSWAEDPTPVMQTLQSYLQIAPEYAPDRLFTKGQEVAQAAIEELAATARRQPGGWLKTRIVRAAVRRIRVLMGVREAPKFFAIRSMDILRQALLETGGEFVAAGTLDSPEDLFYLHIPELESLAALAAGPGGGDGSQTWRGLVAARRQAYAYEARRGQVPRVLVSDGRAFYEGLGAVAEEEDVITGSPVSPGVVEGVVHVIFDPHGARLFPGEILVCPGTDPAWTPLFMAAGGLVTEVGGMMTHGSVVAREYGIPAVVGVHQATQRLRTGQKVRLDGATGKIVVVE